MTTPDGAAKQSLLPRTMNLIVDAGRYVHCHSTQHRMVPELALEVVARFLPPTLCEVCSKQMVRAPL